MKKENKNVNFTWNELHTFSTQNPSNKNYYEQKNSAYKQV